MTERVCGTDGCELPRIPGRAWCSMHNWCELCGVLAVEGRIKGKPRCDDHAEGNQPEEPK